MVCPQHSLKELGGACSFCEELAPFVKKQAFTVVKRARVQNDLPRTKNSSQIDCSFRCIFDLF
jgi:hypothetical protein